MFICVFGKRGSGKTTLIKGQIEKFPKPVIILDLLGNYQDEKAYENFNELSELLATICLDAEEGKHRNKIYSLRCSDPGLCVDYISAALWEIGGGTLVLDEADGFNLSEAPCFDEIIRYGRNRNVHLITGCRRPAEISRDFTAAANTILCFKTNEPRDIDYFKHTVLGDKADELMKVEKYNGIGINHDEERIFWFKTNQKGEIIEIKSENL